MLSSLDWYTVRYTAIHYLWKLFNKLRGGKCLIYSARNASIFKAISVSKIDKVYLTSFEIIFKYVSANQEMYSLHVCAQPIFSYHIFTCLTLRRHSNVIDNLKTVMWRLFFLGGGFDWISPLLNHAITGHVCWYCLAVSVPDWADWTPTVSVCIQNIYGPHSRQPQTYMQSCKNYSSNVCYRKTLTEIHLELHPEI